MQDCPQRIHTGWFTGPEDQPLQRAAITINVNLSHAAAGHSVKA